MAHPLFDFRHLTPAERAQLAVDLWDSIVVEDEAALPIPPAHRAEVARRHAAYLADPCAGAPWEEVEGRMIARLEARRATPREEEAKGLKPGKRTTKQGKGTRKGKATGKATGAGRRRS